MNKLKKHLNTNQIEKKLFWFFSVALFSSFFFYAYFVNQTILNIVERENFEEEIAVLNSEISELEANYLDLKNKITLDYAHSLGFSDAKNIKFASNKLYSQGLSLSY